MELPGPQGFPRDFPGKFESSNISRDDVSREIGRINKEIHIHLIIFMYVYIYIYTHTLYSISGIGRI